MFKGAAEENARVRFDRHPLFRATDQGEFSSALKSRVPSSPTLLLAGERSFHNKWGEERTSFLFLSTPPPSLEPGQIVRAEENRSRIEDFFLFSLSLFIYLSISCLRIRKRKTLAGTMGGAIRNSRSTQAAQPARGQGQVREQCFPSKCAAQLRDYLNGGWEEPGFGVIEVDVRSIFILKLDV